MAKKKKKNTIPIFGSLVAVGAVGALVNKMIADAQERKESTEGLEKIKAQLESGNKPEVVEDAADEFVSQNYAYLQLGDDPDDKYYITSGLNIGRYPHNDIQLAGRESGVSRNHCRIFVKNGRYYVVDTGASVKAQVDGKIVDNEKPTSADLHEFYDYELVEGSKLVVGKYVFTFHENKGQPQRIASAMDAADSTIVVD